MSNMRARIETWFEGLGRWIYDHRWLTLVVTLAVTAPIVLQLPKITLDTRTESYFLEGDIALEQYNEYRDLFGMDEFIIVAINPPEVFDLDFLDRLRALHDDLEQEIPYVAEVTSLVNARHTRGEHDTLIVEDLLEVRPEDPEQLAALRELVLANPVYLNTLISEDATFTTIIIEPVSIAVADEVDVLAGFDDPPESDSEVTGARPEYLAGDQYREMLDAIRDLLKRHESPDFAIHLAGGPVVNDALSRAIPSDMARILPLASLMVAAFLFILFRRISGVVYPILIVWLSLMATLGLMAATGIPMTNTTSMLASFLTVVGIADAVHILSIFYQLYSEKHDKRAAIAGSLGHSGLAVLMTSVTTSAGLLSFVVADVRPIADLGIVAPIGICFALVYTLTLLPAMIAIFPVKQRAAATAHSRVGELLAGIAKVSCGHPKKILAVTLVVALLSAAGMTRLRFSQNGLKWFKEHTEFRQATELIDEKLRGTLSLEVLIDTGTRDGLVDPDFLSRLERSVAYAGSLHSGEAWVGKVMSLDTIIKEINRALNENREEFYSIPRDRDLVAQELLLFEGTGSDDLTDFVDRDYSKVRCSLKVPFRDAFHYVGLIEELSAHFASTFPEAEIRITGTNALYIKMLHNIITTMAKSYVISLSVITVLMVLLIGRVRIGLLSMVPNLLPLVMILGVMGWLDIPLDISTVLIGSVAIGLVVDDTIHFMHNFRRYFEEDGDVANASRRTLDTAGRAILVTSIVLSGGFYISMTSELRSSMIYGGLMGTTALFALVADFYVTPALLVVVNPRRHSNFHGTEKQTIQEGMAS